MNEDPDKSVLLHVLMNLFAQPCSFKSKIINPDVILSYRQSGGKLIKQEAETESTQHWMFI